MNEVLQLFRRYWPLIAAIALVYGILVYPGLFSALESRRSHMDLLRDCQEDEEIEQALRNTIIPSIKFKDRPFVECLTELFQKINELEPSHDWSFEFSEIPSDPTRYRKRVIPPADSEAFNLRILDPERPITLEMSSVSAYKAIMYTCVLADSGFHTDGLHFVISPFQDESWTWQPIERRELSADLFAWETPTSEKGPVDIRHELAEGTGIIEFYEGDQADFWPEKNKIVVQAGAETLSLIEFFLTPRCLFSEESFWQKFSYTMTDGWLLVFDSFDPLPEIPFPSLQNINGDPVDPFATPAPGDPMAKE